MSHSAASLSSLKKTLVLSIAALGVVYGDIGTSPLYAISEIFLGHAHMYLDSEVITGGISLVVWALTLVICLKYIVFVLRADNDGEGGVFALSSLISQIKQKSTLVWLVSTLLVFAAGLLFGDGIITPAISVLSAVEGLGVAAPNLSGFVVPITILILTALFGVQRFGTTKVGSVFGPIIVCWFSVIGMLGLYNIVLYPSILAALNPWHALSFLIHTEFHTLLLVMGSVMLVITGGEAMYADMGHFGRKSIRVSWFSLVYPMLVLNYLGQGAYLLSGNPLINKSIFYSMVPAWGLYPMVILATCATVIASQALISGAFSLTAQAIALGFFPRLKVQYTHHEHEGQRYVPLVNWALYAGAVLLVLAFRSSSRLASAYGLAVSGDMIITTLGMSVIAWHLWKWSLARTIVVFSPFLLLDIMFFTSNSLKFFQGGFIPIVVGLTVMSIMRVWSWGKQRIDLAMAKYPTISVKELISLKKKMTVHLSKPVVIMTPQSVEYLTNKVPVVQQMFLDRYQMIPQDIIFLTVVQHRIPYMENDRYHVTSLYENVTKGSIVSVKMNFGFMEEPDVERHLEGLARHHEIKISEHPKEWLIHIVDDRMVTSAGLSVIKLGIVKLFQIIHRNSLRAVDYFGLGNQIVLSSEVMAIKVAR